MRAWMLLLILMLGAPDALAWDGRWTQAVSGGDALYDAGNKQTDAGTDERPQTYFIPPPRDHWDVDPEELDDYGRKHYTPYALTRITQHINYNGLILGPGYYLIKPGDHNDGSQRVNLHNQPATAYLQAPTAATVVVPQQAPAAGSGMSLPPLEDPAAPAQKTPGDQPTLRLSPAPTGAEAGMHPIANTGQQASGAPASPASPPPANDPQEESPYKVFVIKKLGKVVAVIPIHRMEHFNPPRKTKVPKHAVAWVEMENNHPVLKFYYKKRVYSTDFQ